MYFQTLVKREVYDFDIFYFSRKLLEEWKLLEENVRK